MKRDGFSPFDVIPSGINLASRLELVQIVDEAS